MNTTSPPTNPPNNPPRAQQKYNFPPPGNKWWATNKGAMVKLLWDCAWHTQGECLDASGHRFGGVIHVLRNEGWDIETKKLATSRTGYEYRLVSHIKGPELATRKKLYLSLEATKALAEGVVTDEASAVALEVLEQ